MTEVPHAAPLGGKPSIYTPELAKAICLRLMEGESLRSVCRDEAMPARSTVHVWLRDDAEFRKEYEFAVELRAEGYFEELIEIADEPLVGEKVTVEAEGTTKVTKTTKGDNVDRSKLKSDNRKWVLSRMNPKKYGDRVQQDVTLNKVEVVGGLPDENP